MKEFKLTAKTFAGLEQVLTTELRELGAKNVNPGQRAVFFEGDIEMIYKSNYYLRSALKVLKEIDHFFFKNPDQFYLKCKTINWSDFLDLGQDFAIESTVINSPDFKNSMFASLRVKDAIADYFREKTGKRPNVNTENPDILINIYISGNHCTVSLDSSGESLHKRGYRIHQGDAPLNEVLAAGMILLSGWKGETDFLDPMCGSGTLPIEAAMIAQNIPAGRFRKNFAFENWREFDQILFDNVKSSFVKKDFKHQIFASDISAGSILNAQTNARRALVFNKIKFQKADFRELDIELNRATIIINPPYGERLKEKDINELYAMIGERLKHKFSDNNAWILTSSVDGLKNIGLKPESKIDLFNGALRCKYNNYRLFSGKRTVQIQQ